MKHAALWILPALLALGLTGASRALSAGPSAAPEILIVDAGHSVVLFRIKHVEVAWFYGRFNRVEGEVTFDPGNPEACKVDVKIDVASVDTNDVKRDAHAKSEEFFFASEHPEARFASKTVRATGEGTYAMTGELSLRGVTREVTADFAEVGSGMTFFGDFRRGFEATLAFDRSDFGMTALLPKGLGDEIRLTVSLETIRQP